MMRKEKNSGSTGGIVSSAAAAIWSSPASVNVGV